MTEHRFIAYVTLADTDMCRVTAQTIVERVKTRFGGKISMDIKPPTSQAGGILIDIDGVLITVMLIDKPLPPDATERALQLDRVWPDARETIARNKAHVIIATLNPITNHGQALNSDAYVSFVAASVMDMTNATSLVWEAGDAITKAETFQQATDALAEKQLPVLSWMSLAIGQGPPTATGAPTVIMRTRGVAPFAGREIEFAPSTWPPAQMADRVIGTALYLMQRGPVVKDGDTLGNTSSERITVHLEGETVRLQLEGVSQWV